MNSKEDFMYGVDKKRPLPTADEVWAWFCVFLCGTVVGTILF